MFPTFASQDEWLAHCTDLAMEHIYEHGKQDPSCGWGPDDVRSQDYLCHGCYDILLWVIDTRNLR